MIKSELVARIAAQNPHLYRRDAENVIDAILDQIGSALAQGNRVELRGFGSFSVRVRHARTGRDPRTGAVVHVAEKVMPYFKPWKEMLVRLNLIATDAKTRDSLQAT
jgi:integration host factor subunit beta